MLITILQVNLRLLPIIFHQPFRACLYRKVKTEKPAYALTLTLTVNIMLLSRLRREIGQIY